MKIDGGEDSSDGDSVDLDSDSVDKAVSEDEARENGCTVDDGEDRDCGGGALGKDASGDHGLNLSGTYGQILSYVVSTDFLFFGLTAAALFVFRRRDPAEPGFSVPGHPFTTILFILACAVIVVATVVSNPLNSMIGYLLLLAGIPPCLYWQSRQRRRAP